MNNLTIEMNYVNTFWEFSNFYRHIHGWLSTVVCIFGIASNLLIIIILSRSNMITSQTNLILIGLAFSDMLTMVSSLPYGIYFYIIYGGHSINLPSKERDTLLWTHFSKIHTMTSVTFHSISIWLTVYLACFRYIYLKTSTPSASSNLTRSNQNQNKYILNLSKWISNFFTRFKTYNSTIISIAIIYLFCIIFCLPAYLYPTVRQHTIDQVDPSNKTNSNGQHAISYYVVDQSDLNIKTNGSIFKLMFYSQAFLGKFIPCLLLVIFSSLLLYTLIIINRNKKKLKKLHSGKQKATITNASNWHISNSRLNKSLKSIRNKFSKLNQPKPIQNDIKRDDIDLNIDNCEMQPLSTINNNKLTYDDQILSLPDGNRNVDNNKNTEKLVKFENVKPVIKKKKSNENLRTTVMLILVCILFLLAEFPQSILIFFSIIMDKSFYNDVYMPLGDLLDIIALVNNSINFIIYCAMSKSFRDTFYLLLTSIFSCFSK